jgi:hypothetical protein
MTRSIIRPGRIPFYLAEKNRMFRWKDIACYSGAVPVLRESDVISSGVIAWEIPKWWRPNPVNVGVFKTFLRSFIFWS